MCKAYRGVDPDKCPGCRWVERIRADERAVA